MNKYASGLLVGCILLTACIVYLVVSHKSLVTKDVSVHSVVSVISLKPGDSSGTMRVVSVKSANTEFGPAAPGNVIAQFSGTALVTGTYEYYHSDFDGGWQLDFTPATSSPDLPQVLERSPKFRFTNQQDAERILKITEYKEQHGSVRIKTLDYSLTSYPSEVSDYTKILSAE